RRHGAGPGGGDGSLTRLLLYFEPSVRAARVGRTRPAVRADRRAGRRGGARAPDEPGRTDPYLARRPHLRSDGRPSLLLPGAQGHITDDTRIRASTDCIEMALRAGAAVMVTSHLGRPAEGALEPRDSLAPVAQRLGQLLGLEVPLRTGWVDGVQVAPGQLILL